MTYDCFGGDELWDTHHLIPYGGKKSFQNHKLVTAAKVDLEDYGQNLLKLGNHQGRHTNAYRDVVRAALDKQLDAFRAAGGKNARKFVDLAIEDIEQQIRKGTLRPGNKSSARAC
jgi:hypothetical protein